jgi:1-aminocyclopropane-1-carboxylate deaminase
MKSVQWTYQELSFKESLNELNCTLRQAWHLPEWESGNKRFKLLYNVQDAVQKGFETIITMGGAWSNHLLASAQYAQHQGLKSVGLVRGYWHKEQPTFLMQDCENMGMQVVPIDSALYDERGTEDFKVWLHDHFPHAYFIPEGGANYLGLMGCMEMLTASDRQSFTDVCVCAGTGATAAGLLLSSPHQRIHAFFGLKLSEGEMKEMVRQKLRWVMQDVEVVEEMMQRLEVYSDERWGGFGKIKPELVEWMKMEEEKGVLWDRVYSAKMGFALAHDDLRNAMGTEILVLHTGGLSGNRSLETISV